MDCLFQLSKCTSSLRTVSKSTYLLSTTGSKLLITDITLHVMFFRMLLIELYVHANFMYDIAYVTSLWHLQILTGLSDFSGF